jgi:hypothetical protein
MLSRILKLSYIFEKLAKDRTLYHGTSIDNAKSIMQKGLVPQVGKWVSDSYGASMDLDSESEDYEGLREKPVFELTFATDKEELGKALGGMIAAVAGKLGKQFRDVSDEEIRRFGAIVVMYEAEKDWEKKPKEDSSGQWEYENPQYQTVEPGDYFSENKKFVDRILVGEPMIRLLRQYGVWPRDWGPDSIKNKKEKLIKYLMDNFDATSEQAVKRVAELSDEEVDKYYYQVKYKKE